MSVKCNYVQNKMMEGCDSWGMKRYVMQFTMCPFDTLQEFQKKIISKHTFWIDLEHCPKIINVNEVTFPYLYSKFQTTSYDLVHKLAYLV